MGSKLLEFAPGAFFTPTDRQIIEFYLKPKILGNHLKFDVVVEKEVYGVNSNPWQVLDIHDDDSWFDCADNEFERIRFVYTKLSKMATCNSNSKNNKTRTRENTWKKAGCGTWTAKSKPVEITDFHVNLIGERRYYVFRIKNSDSAASVASQFGYFRMHEFCLSGIYEKFDPSRTRVLCKITHQSCKNLVSPVIAHLETKLTSNLQGAESVKKISVCPEIVDFEKSSTSTLIEPSEVNSEPSEVNSVDSDPIVDTNVLGEDFRFDDQGVVFHFDDQGVDYRFDEAWLNEINEFLNSPVPEDGKRKLEQESFCGTKKLCLG